MVRYEDITLHAHELRRRPFYFIESLSGMNILCTDANLVVARSARDMLESSWIGCKYPKARLEASHQ